MLMIPSETHFIAVSEWVASTLVYLSYDKVWSYSHTTVTVIYD